MRFDGPVTLSPLDRLVELLDLEAIEVDIFRGRMADDPLQRVFGGQVAGQALVAAGRTVSADRAVHSLHAYFLRPGDPGVPIVYEVDRIRDGRSFTTRRVVAIQHGKPIFHLSASFQLAQAGLEHQTTMPEVPGPEGLLRMEDLYAPFTSELGAWFGRPRPMDIRYVDDPPVLAARKDQPRTGSRVWMRADGTLPDDPLLHVCAVAFASDFTLLDSTLLPHGRYFGDGLQLTSLDHAMWFHRPARADAWVLMDLQSRAVSQGRGLYTGGMWSDGVLVASLAQETLYRERR